MRFTNEKGLYLPERQARILANILNQLDQETLLKTEGADYMQVVLNSFFNRRKKAPSNCELERA